MHGCGAGAPQAHGFGKMLARGCTESISRRKTHFHTCSLHEKKRPHDQGRHHGRIVKFSIASVISARYAGCAPSVRHAIGTVKCPVWSPKKVRYRHPHECQSVLGGVLVKLVVDEEIALDAVDGAPCVRVGLGDLSEAPDDG